MGAISKTLNRSVKKLVLSLRYKYKRRCRSKEPHLGHKAFLRNLIPQDRNLRKFPPQQEHLKRKPKYLMEE